MRPRLNALVGQPVVCESADTYPYLVPVALAGAVVAVMMAVFGLPPIDVHGPLHRIGIMDPLCGMTRAARLLARGEVRAAARYNPASLLLPLLAVASAARLAYGWRTGRWWGIRLRSSPLLMVALGVLVIALWVRQQLHADLLQ